MSTLKNALKGWYGACLVSLIAASLMGRVEPAPVLARQEIQADEVPWQKDYSSAREIARKSGKPLFVVFRCER